MRSPHEMIAPTPHIVENMTAHCAMEVQVTKSLCSRHDILRQHVSIDPEYQKRRWVAHLDLLGASSLVERQSWEMVFSVYARAIERFRADAFDETRLSRITFSDSFLIYTDDDSALSYRAIDSFCRHFVRRLVLASVPLRGAIACGDFYADEASSLYFGDALLESHGIGESTDWIGLVLCDSTRARLSEVSLPVENLLNYALWPVPVKRRRGCDATSRELAAYIIGASPTPENVEPVCESLRAMREKVTEPVVQAKYENSLEFLGANVRRITSP